MEEEELMIEEALGTRGGMQACRQASRQAQQAAAYPRRRKKNAVTSFSFTAGRGGGENEVASIRTRRMPACLHAGMPASCVS